MINVSNLIEEKLPGNYFAYNSYIQGDFEAGMIENRAGNRLIALPETLIQATYVAMDKELGQAGGLVLFNCGNWWGKSFFTRFSAEVSNYYQKPLVNLSMIELIQCLKEFWKTHGWGRLDLDINYHQNGFLIVKTWDSPFAENAPQINKPICYVEAGIFASFFSQLSGENLHCVQTSCESMGDDYNQFIVGLKKRLESVSNYLENGENHEQIMNHLCA